MISSDRPLSFGPRLRELRRKRKLGLRALDQLVFVAYSTLSKVENELVAPTMDLARRCDEVLDAGGELVALAARELAEHSGWPRPAQLPAAALGTLMGRDAELAKLEDLVAGSTRPEGRMVVMVLDGSPGAGKTALALAAARRVAEHHVDGVLYRDLQGYAQDQAPVDPAEVLKEFLHALGVRSADLPSGLTERSTLFRSLSHGRRMLLILDNARDAAQVEPLLPLSPRSSVIVTGRGHLTGLARTAGAALLSVGPLDEASALALLGSIIGAERVADEQDEAAALARTCGLLPLALCIAAERVAQHPFHSLAELNAELDASELLGSLTSQDGTGAAMHAVFSWSYRALPRDQARAFRLLGMHPGAEIGTCAAAALFVMTSPESRLVLEGLARARLIAEVARNRWQVHDLLRAYARRLLDEEPDEYREAAAFRLVSWYVHTSHAAEIALAPQRTTTLVPEPHGDGVCPMAFADGDDALAWYRVEAPNFVPVTKLAVHHKLFVWAWQLPVTLWGWLLLERPTDVWLGTHHLGIQAARTTADGYGEGWLLANLGFLLRTRREYDAAERAVGRSLELRKQVGDIHGQAWSLAGLGFLAVDRGHASAALAHFRRALPLFAATEKRPHGRSIVLASMGEAHAELADIDQARHCWDEALSAFLELDDAYGQAWTLAKRGHAEGMLGHHREAINALERSLVLRLQAGDLAGQATSLNSLGETHYRAGDIASARTTFAQALTHYHELGDDQNARDVAERLAQLVKIRR
ncbi:tetratricopeptide repeat protein [Umezawaea sp. Da 62-37]|uniref:tetratricopeptide repeat protein n=1 Tax=Umezawaea sp. Da 62-37 TaxID=3075927 RepID=UPI0028F738A0|nr:tetratricopeptide repeat protein [Umezawaea sp. Da 62-37]WNV83186.1 tetratricopeptide repeat protein [Umezawaea sp. Da 62-37]